MSEKLAPQAHERRPSMRHAFKGIVAAAALAALLSPGAAQADPDELMGCKIGIVKAPPAAGGNGMTKFVQEDAGKQAESTRRTH